METWALRFYISGGLMEHDYREVRFDEYCKHCKHKAKNEDEEPCNECLEEYMNIHTEKPGRLEEIDKK